MKAALPCMLLLIALHAGTAGNTAFAAEQAEPPAANDVHTKLVGKFEPWGDKERRLFIEFIASVPLTETLRNAFKVAGFDVVTERAQAEVVYIFGGAYQAVRPATHRTAEISVGDYADHPEHLVTKSGRGPSVMLSLNPLAMIAGTVLQNAGNATGVQDAVNSTVGDPDGKCLAKCDKWAYKQRAAVSIERYVDGRRVSAIAAQAETTADQLEPDPLIKAALLGLQPLVGIDLSQVYQDRRHQ